MRHLFQSFSKRRFLGGNRLKLLFGPVESLYIVLSMATFQTNNKTTDKMVYKTGEERQNTLD